MFQERVFPPGTKFDIVDQKGHPLFYKSFEVTDTYRDGSTFIKYMNVEGSAEPYERHSHKTSVKDINYAVANGIIVVRGEQPVSQDVQQAPVAPVLTSDPPSSPVETSDPPSPPVETKSESVETKSEPVETKSEPVETKSEPVETPGSDIVKSVPAGEQGQELSASAAEAALGDAAARVGRSHETISAEEVGRVEDVLGTVETVGGDSPDSKR